MFKLKYLYLAATALITILVYMPGLSGPFLLDDYSNRVNAYSYGLDWQEILSATFANQSGILRRPLANLSFILNAINNKSSFGFKLVNLILHLVTGFLLFSLIQKLSSIRSNLTEMQANLTASVVSAIWLLHPLQVSTVLYVVQRMSILSALFSIAALLVYVRFRSSSHNLNRTAALLPLFGGYSAFWILGLASKESAALLPLFVLVIEFCIFRFEGTPDGHSKRNFHLLLTLLVYLPLFAGTIYTLTHFGSLTAGYGARDFTLPERLYTEIHALIFYLKVIITPNLSLMGLYHDDFPISSSMEPITFVYLALIIISVLTALFIRKRFPMSALGILWFYSAHLLESTFLPLEPVFEHRNYLALAGVCMILAEVIMYLLQAGISTKRRIFIWPGVVLFMLFITTLTSFRVDSWSSRDKLFTIQEKYHPDSPRVLMEMVNIDVPQGRFDLAYSRIDKIERLAPNHASPSIMRLIINCYENIHSSQNFNRALRLYSDHHKLLISTSELQNLSILSLNGKCPAYSSKQIIELLLTAAKNHYGIPASILHSMAGQLYTKSGNIDAARKQYGLAHTKDASQLRPLIAKTYLELNSGLLNEAKKTISLLRKDESKTIVYHNHLISELEQHLTIASNKSK